MKVKGINAKKNLQPIDQSLSHNNSYVQFGSVRDSKIDSTLASQQNPTLTPDYSKATLLNNGMLTIAENDPSGNVM